MLDTLTRLPAGAIVAWDITKPKAGHAEIGTNRDHDTYDGPHTAEGWQVAHSPGRKAFYFVRITGETTVKSWGNAPCWRLEVAEADTTTGTVNGRPAVLATPGQVITNKAVARKDQRR